MSPPQRLNVWTSPMFGPLKPQILVYLKIKSKSKLGFSAVGTKANTEELAMELQAREIHNPPETRPKILGTRLILNRPPCRCRAGRDQGLDQSAGHLLHGSGPCHTLWKKRSISTRLLRWQWLQLLAMCDCSHKIILNPIRRAMSDLDHNGHHRLGHVGPLYVSFRDMLPILTLGWVAVLLCKHYLKPVPKILHNGILARPKAHSFC